MNRIYEQMINLPTTSDRNQWSFDQTMNYDRIKNLVMSLDSYGVESSADRRLIDSYLDYFRTLELL